MLNGIVGYQLLDDGTPTSIAAIVASAFAFFIATGYIALDTGYSWTNHFNSSLNSPNRNVPLYVLYQLLPLIFLVAFFVLESILVVKVLGERKPMCKTLLLTSHCDMGDLIDLQCTSVQQHYSLPLGRFSSMSSAYIYVMVRMGRLTGRCLRRCSLYSQ